jgi:Protein of unknown function (DUF3429)
MTNRSPLQRALMYAGTLPFIAGAVLLPIGVTQVTWLGNIKAAVLAYGLTIVSFMAGVHWGQYLAGVRTQVNLLVSSNVATLAAWFGFLLLPPFYFAVLLIILFIVLNAIDGHLRAAGSIDVAYASARRNVTGIVCLALLVAAFA